MQPNGIHLLSAPEDEMPASAFQVCEEHHGRMMETLKEFGIGDKIAQSQEEVNALLAEGKSDPILDVSRVLFTIALNAIGSDELAKLRCPLCAFQKFDFLAKVCGLVAVKYRDQPLLITPPEPKLILTS